MRHVTIIGMQTPGFVMRGLPAPAYGGQVWGCNHAYLHGIKLDRLYLMDPIERFLSNDGPGGRDKDFLGSMRRLADEGTALVSRAQHPKMPRGPRYALNRAQNLIGARSYFTSSIAYMMADAIDEQDAWLNSAYTDLHLDRILLPGSKEYEYQLPCIEFWCGVALGAGMTVHVDSESELMTPRGLPAEAALYGYQWTDDPKPPPKKKAPSKKRAAKKKGVRK